MTRTRFPLAAAALLAGLAGLIAGRQPDEMPPTDEEALKRAGLSATDGPALVKYLKDRSLSDADRGALDQVIRRFGADEYKVRRKASEDILKYGSAAVAPLRAAENDPNPEVAYRASRALKKLQDVPHAAAAAAAVRAVAKLKPSGAAEALVGFLPLAESEALADEIRAALVALAVRDGKADPALVAALVDPSPVRRTAAYAALTEGGPAGQRVRVPDAFPRVKEAVRKDPDLDAKFTGLWTLALTTREKEFVPDLLALVPELPRGRLWQLEEFLLALSGGTFPDGGRFGRSAESLATARDAWLGWWKANGEKVDLAGLVFRPRLKGFTDMVQSDSFGKGRVVSLGPDLKERWRLVGGDTVDDIRPTDARVLPNGNVLVVEQQLNRVTEREPHTGRAVHTWDAGAPVVGPASPVAAEILPNGNVLLVGMSQVVEYDPKAMKPVFAYTRTGPNGQTLSDIVTGRRLPNGDTVFLTGGFQGANCFRIDPKGQPTGTPLTLGRVQMMQGLEVLGEERVLVCEIDRVAEYDLRKPEKPAWTARVNNPTSAQRLPNGNTLVASPNLNRAVELDPAGNDVWFYQGPPGVRVSKAYRR
jgi:hypothetical protein